MVPANNRFIVLVVGARRGNRTACISSVVAGTVVVGSNRRSKTATRPRDGASLRVSVTGDPCAAAALPEFDARALGVVVGGAGTESLFFLMVAAQDKLHEG